MNPTATGFAFNQNGYLLLKNLDGSSQFIYNVKFDSGSNLTVSEAFPLPPFYPPGSFSQYYTVYNDQTSSIPYDPTIVPVIYTVGAAYAPLLSNLMVTPNQTIYGLTSATTTRFQQLASNYTQTKIFNASNYNITLIASADAIPDYMATSNFGYATNNNGGIFFSYQRGNILSPQPIEIVGNSQLGTDIHYGMKTAYQLFYPTMKIEFTKRANKYNDITNLVDIDYFNSNIAFYENFKTQAFFYSSFSNLMQDLGLGRSLRRLGLGLLGRGGCNLLLHGLLVGSHVGIVLHLVRHLLCI